MIIQKKACIIETPWYQTRKKLLASTETERNEIEKQLEIAKSVCESRDKVKRIYSK